MVSYSCMDNVTSVFLAHNRKIRYPTKRQNLVVIVDQRPIVLDNKCLTPKFVYQAEFQNDTNDKMTFYVGFSETPFKEGF